MLYAKEELEPDLEAIASSAAAEFDLQLPSFPDEELYDQNRSLAIALPVAWTLSRYEDFIQEYQVVAIENEWETLLAPNITLQSRVDAVTRRRSDGSLWAWNWKTSGSLNDWSGRWEDDIQAMLETLATQEHFGEYVQGCIFEGFYKGGSYKGRSTSPLVYGYMNGEGKWHVGRPQNFKGWTKRLVNRSYPGGLLAWLEFMFSEDPDTLHEQFVRSEPIFKNDDLVRDWIKQVVREETDVEMMLGEDVPEEDRLIYFKQNKGEHCRWCQFRKICRWEVSLEDMVSSGALVERVDHHKVEES